MDGSNSLPSAAGTEAEYLTRLNQEINKLSHELLHAKELLEATQAETHIAREKLTEAETEIRCLRLRIANLKRENSTLQEMCLEYLGAKDQLARLRATLEGVFGKRAWTLLKKAGKLRSRLNQDQTIAGRSWRFATLLLARVMKTGRRLVALLINAAHARWRWASTRQRLWNNNRRDSGNGLENGVPSLKTFDELPWSRIDKSVGYERRRRGYFKVLLVAHGEESPEALAELLQFAKRLSGNDDLDCRIVLFGSCALADEFAPIIPVLQVDSLVEAGIARTQAAGLIADLYQRSTYHRVAVITTPAKEEFLYACVTRDIGIIHWLVETPHAATCSDVVDRYPAPEVFTDWRELSLGSSASEIGIGEDQTSNIRGSVRTIRPKTESDATNWPQFLAEFLRILEDDHVYHPSRELKVSVIVPSYNYECFLEERLRSIFTQTLPPHEIIFLDDASTDNSVAIAHRLSSESPVPFRIIVNESNSGSTFRQWLKGIDLAKGDLVWIAESDDSCRPELLERLVPEFYNPDVNLAYCQSAMVGPQGERYAENYIEITNEISLTHWIQAYNVSGIDEVELALSQRNTIPNASAVVFRCPVNLDCRSDLEWMKLAGDWLFYAYQIRDGNIAFLPDSLNFHRHHNRTVRHSFERASELVVEQLHVKASIFELFPISNNAISRSVSCTVAEYIIRTAAMGLDRPALTRQPRLESVLGRIRCALRGRCQPKRDLRVLMAVSNVNHIQGQEAAIRLANRLADYFHVFLCTARPWTTEARSLAAVDERITLLEGTLGMTFWVGDRETQPDGTTAEWSVGHRAEIIRELIRLHRIDVIHSRGWWANRLVTEVNPEPSIPWFIDLCYSSDYRKESDRDRDFQRIFGSVLSMIHGAFYSQPDDLEVIPAKTWNRLSQVVRIFDGFGSNPGRQSGPQSATRADNLDRIAALTAEAYLVAAGGTDVQRHDPSGDLQIA